MLDWISCFVLNLLKELKKFFWVEWKSHLHLITINMSICNIDVIGDDFCSPNYVYHRPARRMYDTLGYRNGTYLCSNFSAVAAVDIIGQRRRKQRKFYSCGRLHTKNCNASFYNLLSGWCISGTPWVRVCFGGTVFFSAETLYLLWYIIS